MKTLVQQECNPNYGGGTIVTQSPLVATDIFLIDELLNFIVTEADEKIIVGEIPAGGHFKSTITQLPEQEGSITQRP